ncbi:hypothetical protein A2160_01980 [Candidatus Beckwithbacteria bacterium RBG_13_42_9]|uniref:Uncharacterized protein n=1 Tax=Candidatus Beckwithbacteria bacterium RBG_13_42_9 TaxID=1797457 RepID=A0A1F5E8D6_9BACT|nr:MAG: hypothetical protein A2160_01980 [Candidatus Beckwithbacteria bacterium RBG_13_42_9]
MVDWVVVTGGRQGEIPAAELKIGWRVEGGSVVAVESCPGDQVKITIVRAERGIGPQTEKDSFQCPGASIVDVVIPPEYDPQMVLSPIELARLI